MQSFLVHEFHEVIRWIREIRTSKTKLFKISYGLRRNSLIKDMPFADQNEPLKCIEDL